MARTKASDSEKIWELFIELEAPQQVIVLKDLQETHELCVRRDNRGKKRAPKAEPVEIQAQTAYGPGDAA